MNLRFLSLIAFAPEGIDSKEDKDVVDKDYYKPLIESLLNNIYKFRNILESKEGYHIKIPKIDDMIEPESDSYEDSSRYDASMNIPNIMKNEDDIEAKSKMMMNESEQFSELIH